MNGDDCNGPYGQYDFPMDCGLPSSRSNALSNSLADALTGGALSNGFAQSMMVQTQQGQQGTSFQGSMDANHQQQNVFHDQRAMSVPAMHQPQFMFTGNVPSFGAWGNRSGTTSTINTVASHNQVFMRNEHQRVPDQAQHAMQFRAQSGGYPLIESHQHPGPFPHMMATAAQYPPHTNDRNDSFQQPSISTEVAKFRAFDQQQQGNGSIGTFTGRMHSLDTNGVATFGQESSVEPTPSPKSEKQPAAKVCIPRASKSGPASKEYLVPARPKPGRKPIETDPDNKRKLQNRHAQRAFRDRRAQKVHELQLQLDAMKDRHELSIAELKAQLEEQRKCNQEQQQQHHREIEEWKSKAANLEGLLDESRRRNSNGPTAADEQRYAYSAVPTPPEERDEMETDFTAMFAARKPAFSLGEDHQMGGSPIDDPCGFCTTPDNCMCAQAAEDRARQAQALPPISTERAAQPVALKHTSTPSYMEAPTRATGPGQCDMCLTDPERAARCQALARSSQYSGSQTAALSTRSNSIATSDPRMSCTDFFTKAQQRNLQLGPDVLSRVHAYPYTRHGDAGPSHSPAMEIDAHDAAHALAEMSRGLGSTDRS